MRLQLFADEAGAAEINETAPGAEKTEQTDVPEVQDAADEEKETQADGETPVTEENQDSGDDFLRLAKIAQSLACAKADARIKSNFNSEAEKMKESYPDFCLENELENERFRTLFLMGADMKTAYESAHFDEIIASAMRYAARKTAEKTARATSTRVGENAVLGVSASVRRPDVNSLTQADIRRIIREAQSGAKITFT